MKLIFLLLMSFNLWAKNPVVLMQTSSGDVEIELFEKEAPITVKNFLSYVDSGFYNGTIFHRVISNFMIQGGGFDKKMNEKKTNAPIKNEATNKIANEIGTIAMARLPSPHSATAQFFINVENNTFLNHRDTSDAGFGYAVFGKVIKGMPVVNKIKAVKTGTQNGMGDVPLDIVEIIKITKK